MSKNPNGSSLLDPHQITKRVYDEPNDAIRVVGDFSGSGSGGSQEVIINQIDDSIAIGDGTKLYTGTDIASKHGLDVYVAGGVVSGDFTSSGLKTGLKTSVITVTDVPTKIPAIPLANRNGMSVRVWGSANVYFGNSSVNAAAGYPKRQFEEIILDVKDTSAVELYAICDSGVTCELRILELA